MSSTANSLPEGRAIAHVDTAQTARAAGVRMMRAQARNDHPLFIEMLAEIVERERTL